MKQIMQDPKTGKLKIEEVSMPSIKSGGVLVRTHFSLISSGTERAIIESSRGSCIGAAKDSPRRVKQLIEAVKNGGLKEIYNLAKDRLNKSTAPTALGYSSSGTVIEAGEDACEFQAGDRVSCAGTGYASHAQIVFVPKNLCVKIPAGVSFEEASYAALGAVALHGARLADARLGETVAVIGLGLIGLVTVQLLEAAGCTVIGIARDQSAVDNAKRCGADYAININSESYNSLVRSTAGAGGMDAVIITAATESNQPVKLAGEIARKKGRVIVVGDVGLDIPREIYYSKELDFKISCSFGPGRHDPDYEDKGIDYPIPYVRWTEKRNMEAFLRFLKERRIDMNKITTHKFKLENADEAYGLILRKKAERSIGILLEYDENISGTDR